MTGSMLTEAPAEPQCKISLIVGGVDSPESSTCVSADVDSNSNCHKGSGSEAKHWLLWVGNSFLVDVKELVSITSFNFHSGPIMLSFALAQLKVLERFLDTSDGWCIEASKGSKAIVTSETVIRVQLFAAVLHLMANRRLSLQPSIKISLNNHVDGVEFF